ncbi:MAG: M48 family metalloprotease [Spirochaetales bacterium]|nr:M48 family metalloprotease [Spirochaetales bacterium]MCF7939618.1 M48 family metalloprotease [Spirochaetales bacterium]
MHIQRDHSIGYVLIAAMVVVIVSSCGTLASIGAGIGEATGAIDSRQADSIRETGSRVERSFEDFTPEQEYYIGRSVGARVLERYPEYDKQEANKYVATIGNVLVLSSERPSLYAGYSFQILDDKEINAFATPGGHIFITRGMMELADNEDELAAVLAHEIAHIQESHGLQSIRTSRITSALTSAAITGAYVAGSDEVAELTDIFSDSIDDVTQTLFTAGYSRSSEEEADTAAVAILRRAGYSPRALLTFLEEMDTDWEQDGPGFMQTHPSPRDRMEDVEAALHDDDSDVDERRTKRFEQVIGSL